MMRKGCVNLFQVIVAAFIFFSAVGEGSKIPLLGVVDDLPFDQNNRLASTWLLQSESGCQVLADTPLPVRMALMPIQMVSFFGFENVNEQECYRVWLNQGAPKHLLHAVLPEQKYSPSKELSVWIDSVRGKERGWVSYYPTNLVISWVSQTGERREVALLKPGEVNTVWLSSYIGHTFEIHDQETGELVDTTPVLFDGVQIIGTPTRETTLPNSEEVKEGVRITLENEFDRSSLVKRTYTSLGFDKGRLPEDIFCSILTYYYNNYNNAFVEEWNGLFHVNWWEADNWMVGMPWGLKGMWQERLRELVETWIGGVPLENTDIYGIRRYVDGAWLLSHTDREETHATSVIINVDQEEMREDWMVEIYDFAGRLHEIPMKPGDIVYYESARCLHGRMNPLKGKAYTNLFSHYRPVGDPAWFQKENPPGSTEPLMHVGQCRLEKGPDGVEVPSCDNADVSSMPYLSPQLETLDHEGDLFRYWEKVVLNKV